MSFLDELRDQFARDQAESESSGGGSQKYVRMPKGKGTVVIRLLGPAPAGAFNRQRSPFVVKSRVHNINGMWLHDPREEDPSNPKRLVGENAIAEYLRWLWSESEKRGAEEKKAMQDRYRTLKPKKYHYFACIVREMRDENNNVLTNVGPLILRCGEQLYTQIMLPIFGDEKLGQPALGDVSNPQTGRDFRIVQDLAKSGDREYPSYHKSAYLDPSPLGTPEQIAQWIANTPDLMAERIPAPPEVLREQLEIFLGTRKPANVNGFDPGKYGLDSDAAAGLKETEQASVASVASVQTAPVSALPPTTAPVASVAPPVTSAPVIATPAPVVVETPVAPPVTQVASPGIQTENLLDSDAFLSAINSLGK